MWDKTKDELREEFSRQVNKRKSTAKWCKGKVGREHDPELVINHNFTWSGCRWNTSRFWSQKTWNEGPWRYSCRHAYRCKGCGKYTEYVLKDVTQCPEYGPAPAAG